MGVLAGAFLGFAALMVAAARDVKLGLISVGGFAGAALVFALAPTVLLAPFGTEPEVFTTSVGLLWICATFQIFDATAEVAEGTLAGLGMTRWVLGTSIVEAWLVRLPISAFLALELGMGVRGIYWGLAIGLTLRGIAGALRVWWGERRLSAPEVLGAAALGRG